MKALIVRIHPDVGAGTFETLLERRGFELAHALAGTEALPPPEDFDVVIVGGTPDSIRDLGRHTALLAASAWLPCCLECGTPLLGICGGAQLLAHRLGAPVTRAARPELGRRTVRLTPEGRADPVLAGFPERFDVFEWHEDTFGLPPGAVRLAGSGDCPDQIFRHGAAVGLQFHLEFTATSVAALAAAYPEAVRAMGRSREEIVAECRDLEAEMARLADLLLGNLPGLRGATGGR
jgi:GMP synthase (glutamine-hydrolysing)